MLMSFLCDNQNVEIGEWRKIDNAKWKRNANVIMTEEEKHY